MATKISNILVRAIVFFAVVGILFLLTMYNAKLLYTLNWFKTENRLFDRLIIIIAAVAYSLGSIAVVIWYNPTKKQNENKVSFKLRYTGSIILKLLFVIIDGIHVYIYNNTHIEDLAKWLSPVYALQTSFILFFIGAIVNDIIKNGKEKEEIEKEAKTAFENEIEIKESKILSLQTKVDDLETDINNLKSDIETKNTIIKDAQSEIQSHQTLLSEIKSQLNDKDRKISELQTYRKAFLKSEKSRILKKKVENRTDKELEILADAELIG